MNITQLEAFKSKIVRMLHPWKWNPTTDQLTRLAQDFSQKEPKTLSQAIQLFLKHFPNQQFLTLDGVDNSDYSTLLALALADAKAALK